MPKNEMIYVVEGFAFYSETEAEQAKKEYEAIKYMKEKSDMSKPDLMLQIYNRMVKEKMFVTSAGYAFLYDLQEYLRTNPGIKDEEILPIQIVHPSIQESLQEEKHQEQLKEEEEKSVKKTMTDSEAMKKYKFSLVVNVILIISVVFMFFISATSGHPTILNYEQEIINRYSEWEQDLTEREAALREAEN